MKKILLAVIASSLLMIAPANSEMGVGITANFASTDVSGSETLRGVSKVTNHTQQEDLVLPEIFVEYIGDRGSLGLAYIPVQELGKKSRTDSNTAGDSGTYTAEAEIESHAMLYADLNLTEVYGQMLYAKVGVASAEIKTLEALNSGSTYADKTVLGTTIGAGIKADLLSSGLYYKIEGTYTDYEDYESNDTAGNKVKAELDVTSLKVSLGYKF